MRPLVSLQRRACARVERAELLMSKLGRVPPRLAMRVLDRPSDSGRRHTIAKIAALLSPSRRPRGPEGASSMGCNGPPMSAPVSGNVARSS